MNTLNIISRLESPEVLVCDGATGTNLQKRGLEKGDPAEKWVLEKPENIKQLYQDFADAGSDIILSCTFGASKIRLEQHSLSDSFNIINQTAVALAKEVTSNKEIFIAGSMGPLGQLMQPLGLLSEEDVFTAYAQQAELLSNAGVDFLLIETQFDLNEANTAIKACHSVSSLPIVCSFSFDRGTRTMMGVKPHQFVDSVEELDIQVIGINCGRSLEENVEVLNTISHLTNKPIWFKPNAGLPSVDSKGNTIYSVSPEEMGKAAKGWVNSGAKIVGGCCGSTPQHVKCISDAIRNINK